jgi:hypothetical protein
LQLTLEERAAGGYHNSYRHTAILQFLSIKFLMLNHVTFKKYKASDRFKFQNAVCIEALNFGTVHYQFWGYQDENL